MEYGSAQSILTSTGLVVFNNLQSDGGMGLNLGTGNGYLLQVVRGNAYPQIRNPVSNKPQKDGGIVHPFFKGAKMIEFDGLVIATTAAKRQTLDDHLRGSLDILLSESGTYTWTPPGAANRSHTIYLFEPVTILPAGGGGVAGTNAAPKTFAFTLIAPKTDTELH